MKQHYKFITLTIIKLITQLICIKVLYIQKSEFELSYNNIKKTLTLTRSCICLVQRWCSSNMDCQVFGMFGSLSFPATATATARSLHPRSSQCSP